MKSMDGVTPRRVKRGARPPRQAPAPLPMVVPTAGQSGPLQPAGQPPVSQPMESRRQLTWLLVGLTTAILVVGWILLARADLIFPSRGGNVNAKTSSGIDIRGFFDKVQSFFTRQTNESTNLQVEELEQQVFPQFNNVNQ